jgi:hypothetical protein
MSHIKIFFTAYTLRANALALRDIRLRRTSYMLEPLYDLEGDLSHRFRFSLTSLSPAHILKNPVRVMHLQILSSH